MESEDGDVVQRVEKVALRRKLTGPPRLLLPSRTRTRRTDGHKTRTNNDESSQTKIHQEVHEGSCRGRCEADDVRNMKVKRRRWWRRFTPELECVRRQRTKDEEVPPEGALQETLNAALKNTNEEERSEEVVTGRSRFKVRTWSRIRRMRDFLSRGWRRRRRRRSTVDEEEETQQKEEVKCSPDGLTTGGSVEVTAEVSDEPPGAERVKTCDLKEEEEEEQTNDTPDEDLEVVPPSEGGQEEADHTPSRLPRPNGPSILIQLVPPDEATLDDEEEEVWELSASSENQNLLFLLLAAEPSERQLLQMARSLVRAAVSAAVDQLSRERSETNCLEGRPDFTLTAERTKVNV